MQPPALPTRYDVLRVAGQGGMGVVWQARDSLLDADVAVKVPHPSLAADTRFRDRLLLEVQLAARCEHPCLVPLHDLGTLADGTPWVAMAWATGGSLDGWSGPWDEVRRRISDVLRGLAALHARGVLHRDIKPANVLIHGQRTWIADLGLAGAMDDITRGPAVVAGSGDYMPPEQRQGRMRELCPSTDLYAVGRLLDELTRGQDVPADLEALIAVMTHPDPLGRFDLAADATHALQRLSGPSVRRSEVGPRPEPSATFTFSDEPPPDAAIDAAPDLGDRPAVWNRPEPGPMPEVPPETTRHDDALRRSLRLFSVRELPLVARRAELARLWSLAREVVATGETRLVVVQGEPGVGKTRLVAELARSLEIGGWMEVMVTRYRARHRPGDGLRGTALRLLRLEDADTEAERDRDARLQARLARDGVDVPLQTLTEWAEGRAPEEVAGRFLHAHRVARAWRGGVCWVIEDLQWAHPGVVRELFSQLMARSEAALVVITVRTGELSEAMQQQVHQLVELGATTLSVGRLDHAGYAELLERSVALEPATALRLAGVGVGVPLFARQLVLHWAEAGLLRRLPDHRWRLEQLGPVEVPESVEAIVLERVGRAVAGAADPGLMREALHQLALAGTDLPDLVVRRLTGDALPDLVANGLLGRADGRWSWDHELVRVAVASAAERAPDVPLRYLAIALAWQELDRTDDEAMAAIAVALVRAGHPHQAMEPLHEVLLNNRVRAGFHELYAAFVQVAELAPDHPTAVHLPLHLGTLQMATGDTAAAVEQLDRAIEVESAGGHELELTSALLRRGRVARDQGQLRRSKELLSRALEHAPNASLRSWARANLALTCAWLGEVEQSRRHLDLVEARDSDLTPGWVALAEAIWHTLTGRDDTVDAWLEIALRKAHDLGDRYLETQVLCMSADRLMSTDPAGAEQLARQVLTIVGADVPGRYQALSLIADSRRKRGDLTGALQDYTSLLDAAEAEGRAEKATLARMHMALVALELRDWGEALWALAPADAFLSTSGHWLAGIGWLVRAAAYAGQVQRARCTECVERAAAHTLLPLDDDDTRSVTDQLEAMARAHGWPEVVQALQQLRG